MKLGLEGKIAWVAGGTGALGQAIALALAEEGAIPVVSSRRAEAAAAVARDIAAATGIEAIGAAMDSTDEDSVRRAAEDIVRRRGRIDILVNSMGVPAFGDFLEIGHSVWKAAVDTKYLGYVACMREALRPMVAQRYGRIVNITGTGGRLPNAIHMPGSSVNAALNLVTKGIANFYADRNIRANAVSPGPIRSPRQDEMIRAAGRDPAAAIPMKRLGEARDVSDAVLFLVSDRSDYVTGSVLQVDGGAILAL
jgi:NAD(P)-dependent dehydrogenase (short-subunit alcohol dehydrogenase family)